ncbi:hypothetical protein IAU59_005938 [Kwoniella sp. CBS 9459]
METGQSSTSRVPVSLSNLLNQPVGQEDLPDPIPILSPSSSSPIRRTASPSLRVTVRHEGSELFRSLRQRSPIRSAPGTEQRQPKQNSLIRQTPVQSTSVGRNRSRSPPVRSRKDRPPELMLPHVSDAAWAHPFHGPGMAPRTAPITRPPGDYFPGHLQRGFSDDGWQRSRARKEEERPSRVTQTQTLPQGFADSSVQRHPVLRHLMPDAWLFLASDQAPGHEHRARSEQERHAHRQGWEDAMHAIRTGIISTQSGDLFRVNLASPDIRQAPDLPGSSFMGYHPSGDVPQPQSSTASLPLLPPHQSVSLRRPQRTRAPVEHEIQPRQSEFIGQYNVTHHGHGQSSPYRSNLGHIRHPRVIHPPPSIEHFDPFRPPFGPPSNSSSSPGGHSGPSRRSKRQQISCWPCRERKMKCDGGRPCASCAKRHIDGLCNYAESVRRRGRGKKAAETGKDSDPDDEFEHGHEHDHDQPEASTSAEQGGMREEGKGDD